MTPTMTPVRMLAFSVPLLENWRPARPRRPSPECWPPVKGSGEEGEEEEEEAAELRSWRSRGMYISCTPSHRGEGFIAVLCLSVESHKGPMASSDSKKQTVTLRRVQDARRGERSMQRTKNHVGAPLNKRRGGPRETGMQDEKENLSPERQGGEGDGP
jgi:hypothetical protein